MLSPVEPSFGSFLKNLFQLKKEKSGIVLVLTTPFLVNCFIGQNAVFYHYFTV